MNNAAVAKFFPDTKRKHFAFALSFWCVFFTTIHTTKELHQRTSGLADKEVSIKKEILKNLIPKTSHDHIQPLITAIGRSLMAFFEMPAS